MNQAKFLIIYSIVLSITLPIKSKKSTQKNNYILICADDLGRGMLSCYGQKLFKTPNIDKLYQNGFSFNNAYGCMVSAASRASLLTGYHDCRIANNDKWNIQYGGLYLRNKIFNEKTKELNLQQLKEQEAFIEKCRVKLAKEDYYLPQIFKKAGYVTGEIGKLEWGWTGSCQQMKDHGWDYYYGYLDHNRCHGYYPPFLFENGEIVRIKGNNRNDCGKTKEPETDAAFKQRWNMQGKKVYSSDLFMNKIKKFIHENKDTSFFLYYPAQLPHGPVMIPKVNSAVKNNPNLTEIEKEYASMVLLLDKQVGMILDLLKKYHLDKNTYIIFTSDNGHEIYYAQKGRINKRYSDQEGRIFDDDSYLYRSKLAGDIFNGNDGFAGLKRSNLEGGVRVPLICYGPDIPISDSNKDAVALYDLLPTFADWLSVELKTKKSGLSLLPLIKDSQHLEEDRTIYFSSYRGAAMVRNDGWKIRRINNHTQLYNIHSDPYETKDLSKKYPIRTIHFEEELLRVCKGNWDNGLCNY